MAVKKNYTATADFEYAGWGSFKAGDKVVKPADWLVAQSKDDQLQIQDKKTIAEKRAKIIQSGGGVPDSLKYERRRTAFVYEEPVIEGDDIVGSRSRYAILPVK